MHEIGPRHDLTYRARILQPLFQRLQAVESVAMVGAASMGKSRLLQFMLQPEVRAHYLGAQAETTLFLSVDCNRLHEISPFALYELILTSLVESAGDYTALAELRAQFISLRNEVITAQNALLAQRNLELALRMVCREHAQSVCIVLDEFDEALETLPGQTLATLRALRDANKYRLTYVLFLRDAPGDIRPPDDYEGLFELLSRGIIGLTPYGEEDTARILAQISTRRHHELPPLDQAAKQELLHLSGGHPGLLVALLDALTATPPMGRAWEDWAMEDVKVREELRKLWVGLRPEERRTLNFAANQMPTDFRQRAPLLLKGLIQEDASHTVAFFSPLLARYARVHAPLASAPLRIDAGLVFVDGTQIDVLTHREQTLMEFLYAHKGEICSTEEIIDHLYRGVEHTADPTAVATWVMRLRKKIEPNPKRPIYIVSAPGRGYRLVVNPE